MCDNIPDQELHISPVDESKTTDMADREESYPWTNDDQESRVLQMNQLNKDSSNGATPGLMQPCPDILMNISHYPQLTADQSATKQCHDDKDIPYYNKDIPYEEEKTPFNQGPWKSKDLGELVPDMQETAKLKKKRQQRKLKKGLGWTFWIACAPLAICFNLIREQPDDPDDPYDWNDDPLRPWRYKVTLPVART